MIVPVVSVLFLTAGTAFAAHPLITDDTGTQGKRKFQLEVNGGVGRDNESLNGIETRETSAGLETVLSGGLTDTVDLIVAVPWVWSRVKEGGVVGSNENGPGDVALELKWRFLEYKGFSLAVKPGVAFPSGNENRGLGNGRISYRVDLIATQELEPFNIHVNLAYTHNEFKLDLNKQSNHRDIWHASLAATYDVMKDLQLVANVGMESNGDRGNTWPAFVLGGAIYSLTENLDVDLGVKGGLNKQEPDLALMVGVAWRF
jgi:predicted porin